MHPRDIATATAPMAPPSAEDATRLRRIIDGAPVSLARVAADGTTLALNEAAVALVGIDRASEALAQPFARFVARQDQQEWAAFLARVCAGEAGTVELAGRAASGAERLLELSGAPLAVDDHGRPSALLVLRDVGARRALELAALALNERAHDDATLLTDRVRTIEHLQQRLRAANTDLARLQHERAVAVPQDPTDQSDEVTWVDDRDDHDIGDRHQVRQTHAPEFSERPPRGSAQPVATAEVVRDAIATTVSERSTTRARIDALEAALEAARVTAATQARLVQESDLERVAALRTAEYLETQRARLAEALRQARAEHQRTEDARGALDAALTDSHTAAAAQIADARQAATRLTSRLDALEAAHARALAGQAGLQIELTRLRDAHAATLAESAARRGATEAEVETLRADIGRMTEHQTALERRSAEQDAECAGLKETLKDALADFEDLTTWGKARSGLLAQAIRGQAGAKALATEGLDARLD